MGTRKDKSPVKLRQKELANGNKSLYLDVYIKGSRKYEFLNLYLIPEHNAGDRRTNAQTLELAEKVRNKRLVELQEGQFDFVKKTDTPKLLDWLDIVRVEKENVMAHKTKFSSWTTLISHVKNFKYGDVHLSELDTEWAYRYKDYLSSVGRFVGKESKGLQQNSIANMMRHMNTALNLAVKRGYISKNPMDNIEKVNKKVTERCYLTIEEVRQLAKTPTKNVNMKNTFLFSCLTGLRISDIVNLKWGDVSEYEGFVRLTFVQWKTSGQMYLDITEQAVPYMGERGKPEDKVFGFVPSNGKRSKMLRKWAASAGIDKPITFHSARHTFAVMMLALGVDLYTTSKLLGHTDVRTTQIYAKVLDKSKRDAVSKIPKVEL